MTENEFDYKNYDSLKLALKADAKDKMLEYYSAFGWEAYFTEDDRQYSDIVHVKLRRPHKIKNKEKLQLLQVRMESAVNRFAAARRDRHSGSLIVTLTLSLIGALIIFLGILLAVKLPSATFITLGTVASLAGLALPISFIPYIIRRFKRENAGFSEAYRKMGAEIARILSTLERLREDADE